MPSPKTNIRVQFYNSELLFVALIFAVLTGISISLDYPHKKIISLTIGSISVIIFLTHLVLDPKLGLLEKVKNRDENK
ncbi:MAG: hypothetical protein HQL32_09540 [Planctomycetes bacterium]|nr:hypothetical protein [Planctomycetota bacterium]